ncbi:MAG: toll/interleukin-1 receptor domain-containing protein [Alphaproteobacteria bacterium]|nr:toll/interleukin-1 receptor domain-containing protein [Alphaproteobacteria bacterium]
MKIFISHSSKNASYGQALVELLTSIGIAHGDITFTSDTSYGIPSGQNIFNWLKGKISEKPFVIYLLSKDYFSSVACLNEMGAAWVIENQHIAIFTPDFDIDSKDFQSAVLDPREMGFRLNDPDRLTQFAEHIKAVFDLSTNQVLVNRACMKFLSAIGGITSAITLQSPSPPRATPVTHSKNASPQTVPQQQSAAPSSSMSRASGKRLPPTERFFKDLEDGKLKDEEVLLVYYASETGRFSLGVGWRTDEETKRIAEWEELNELSDTLSKKYEAAISRFEVRNLIEVSETTSHGNPRQVDFVSELKGQMLDLPDILHVKAEEIIQIELDKKKGELDDEFPF